MPEVLGTDPNATDPYTTNPNATDPYTTNSTCATWSPFSETR